MRPRPAEKDMPTHGFTYRFTPQSTLTPAAYRGTAYVRVGDLLLLRQPWEEGRAVEPAAFHTARLNVDLPEADPTGLEAAALRALAALPCHAADALLGGAFGPAHPKLPLTPLVLERD